MTNEQAEIVTFRHKALAAPSIVEMEKQTLLKQRNAPFMRLFHFLKNVKATFGFRLEVFMRLFHEIISFFCVNLIF